MGRRAPDDRDMEGKIARRVFGGDALSSAEYRARAVEWRLRFDTPAGKREAAMVPWEG